MTTSIHASDVVLAIRDARRSFPSHEKGGADIVAVDGISLDISAGEIVALLGPNGAGKTTTLDMVLGFTTPTTGDLEVFGTSASQAVLGGRVAAVLQTGGLLRDLTIRETTELIASTHDNPEPVDAVLARAGLTSLESQKVQSCSGGEQQRLRFALALLGDPELLILDEPTAGMDVDARRQFWSVMAAEADRGRTVMFATHYLQEAEDFAQRTILMSHGRIVADGPTHEIRARAARARVRARFAPENIERAADRLAHHRSVGAVRVDGHRLSIDTSASDEIALLVLSELDGSDLEVSAASLEDAFVQLTTAKQGTH